MRARAREGIDADKTEPRQVVEAWNTMARDTGLSEVVSLDSNRASRLKQRLREHGAGEIVRAIGRIGRSSFCHGGGPRGWSANFDFLLKPGSLTRALDGVYDDCRGGRRDRHDGFRQIDAGIAAMREQWERQQAAQRIAA
jgi:hypothetical protein